MTSYPVTLDVRGRPVLVVGGGRVAARKVAGLVAAGAVVTVVAPRIDDAVRASAARVVERAYRPPDVEGQRLVITATDDPAVNAAVAADADAAGVWVNSADDPANCTFTLPAVARRGPVTVAVSTAGASPALASWLRDLVSRHVDDVVGDVAALAAQLAQRRAAVHAAGASTEDVDWGPVIEELLEAGPGPDPGAGGRSA